jgi:hypothetical protein
MFYNSTTLYRFPKHSARLGGEKRMVYGFVDSLKNFWENTMSVGKFAKRWAWRVSYSFGFPWMVKGGKYAIEKGKEAAIAGRTGLNTGVAFAKGVRDMTLKPLLFRMGVEAPIRRTKRLLWDVPIQTIRSAVQTITSPFEWLKGAGASLRKAWDAGKNVFKLNGGEVIRNTRDSIVEALKTPFRPFIKTAKATRDWVGSIVGAELVYPYAFAAAAGDVRDGYSQILNCRETGRATTAQQLMEAEMTKKEKEAEKEQEEEAQKGGGTKRMRKE